MHMMIMAAPTDATMKIKMTFAVKNSVMGLEVAVDDVDSGVTPVLVVGVAVTELADGDIDDDVDNIDDTDIVASPVSTGVGIGVVVTTLPPPAVDRLVLSGSIIAVDEGSTPDLAMRETFAL